MKNWNNNDKGQVIVQYGCLTAYCYTDSPYYFSAVTAKLSHMTDDNRAVFKDSRGNYATTRRHFRGENEVKRLAQG